MASLDNDDVKVDVLRLMNQGESYRKIQEHTGVSYSSVARFVRKETYRDWWTKYEKPIAAGDLYDHRSEAERLKGKRFIITSAQNNTFVHKGFLDSLKVMADEIDARIIVGTFSYNTNGFQNLENGEGDWFDPKITDYILDEPAELAEGLLWCGELNILPTAVNPLSGLHSYTKSASGIFPHAKVQLESVPTHKQDPCKLLYTTGSVTLRNYIQKKMGQKASFHHVFGALLVEVDEEGDWFVRQLIANSEDGSFYDLDTLYTPNGSSSGHYTEALNWGDIHTEKLDPVVADASFYNEGSILNYLRPRYQFIHDVLDFEARNHHNIKDPYFRFSMHIKGKDNVQDNVRQVAEFLESIERDYSTPIIVESNHDLALKRWLKEADYKTDPENAVFFLENQLAIYKSIQEGDKDFSVFGNAVKNTNPDLKAIFLKTDESFRICEDEGGIECGQHGHMGANGSNGGIAVYQKLGIRYNIGHIHSTGIKDGVYAAGVSAKMDMGYNKGASSWSQSHIVTYSNGKRAILTLKNGKWKA